MASTWDRGGHLHDASDWDHPPDKSKVHYTSTKHLPYRVLLEDQCLLKKVACALPYLSEGQTEKQAHFPDSKKDPLPSDSICHAFAGDQGNYTKPTFETKRKLADVQ